MTSVDVAALAGVSQSAVSRAFSPGAVIAEATREKIFEAANKLNYVPNSFARGLSTRRSNIVALVLGNRDNPFYMMALHEFSRKLGAIGRQALVFAVEREENSDRALMEVLQYQVDGVVLTSAHMSTRMTAMCHDRGIPVVSFNRILPSLETPSVSCDNRNGGKILGEAFLAAGARSFAVLAGDANGSTSNDRVRGFTDAVLAAGLPGDSIRLFEAHSTYEGGAAATREMIEGGFRPDAIFGIADVIAMGAIDELTYRYQLRVPEDVMVAGFDNIPESGRLPYRLTTIEQPVAAMVERTIAHLHLDDPDRGVGPAEATHIPGRLVWRDTIRGEAFRPT
ncbi:LacI family transcriptional regulator [Allosediminivita pacifica]|nr:LacI family transcriptional regulator [Allosediminivita pacifica]